MASRKINYVLQNTRLFTEFSYIWLSYLEFCRMQKMGFIHLKYSLCRPPHTASRGGSSTRLPPDIPLHSL